MAEGERRPVTIFFTDIVGSTAEVNYIFLHRGYLFSPGHRQPKN